MDSLDKQIALEQDAVKWHETKLIRAKMRLKNLENLKLLAEQIQMYSRATGLEMDEQVQMERYIDNAVYHYKVTILNKKVYDYKPLGKISNDYNGLIDRFTDQELTEAYHEAIMTTSKSSC